MFVKMVHVIYVVEGYTSMGKFWLLVLVINKLT